MKSHFAKNQTSRWIIATLLIAVTSLMVVGTTVAEDKPAADKAWIAFERARQPAAPPKEWYTTNPSDEEIKAHYAKQAVRATAAADMAKEFYQDYPDDERANDARLFEYHLLGAVMQLGDLSVSDRADALSAELVADESIPEDERITLMLTSARGILQSATDETLVEALKQSNDKILVIMEQFPDNPAPAQMLLQVADLLNKVGESEKAINSFRRVIDGSYPEQLKQLAKSTVAKYDQIGKPIEASFTSTDGREIDIANLKGKVVLLDFWATWCGPCMAGLPELLETYEKFHDQGFEILGINVDNDINALNKVVTERDMKWPQFFDTENDFNRIAEQYGVNAFPTLWLVGKEGKLRYVNARMDLAGKIEKLLAE